MACCFGSKSSYRNKTNKNSESTSLFPTIGTSHTAKQPTASLQQS
jgi:hypothetical protein